MKYNDQYATCRSTYATLRILHEDLDPDEISRLLGVTPSSSHRKSDPLSPRFPEKGRRKVGAWLLKSEGQVDSRDSRRHVDWLIDRLDGKAVVVRNLQSVGHTIDISCYWLSASGHGGPSVPPEQARRLADLGIELWFDVYFAGEE